MLKQCLEMKARVFRMHVFLVYNLILLELLDLDFFPKHVGSDTTIGRGGSN